MMIAFVKAEQEGRLSGAECSVSDCPILLPPRILLSDLRLRKAGLSPHL